ncbi:hypothetical protein [Streptomyces anulatus]|uniref:hypothetical protein n=1 Tax=Streptomyces anulatus TaxID=1892 RepID=UPI0037DC49E0|nr:hypothetical protein OG536_39105 [Streptomyces anulatus]WSW88314.1 hypothetical protein OG536_39015 [Streptomyces anulatus]
MDGQKLWAIEALTGAAWRRDLVLSRPEGKTDEQNRKRLLGMVTLMNWQDPELLWRAVEVTIGPDGSEDITVLANNG